MRRIVLKDAINAGMMEVIKTRSIFFTPEHLLLPFLSDDGVRLLLSGIKMDPSALTDMVTDYVNRLPKFTGRVAKQVSIQSLAIERILARLGEKGQDWKTPTSVRGENFLEAYAYDGLEEGRDMPPSMIASLFAQRHSKIELAVYRLLPRT